MMMRSMTERSVIGVFQSLVKLFVTRLMNYNFKNSQIFPTFLPFVHMRNSTNVDLYLVLINLLHTLH